MRTLAAFLLILAPGLVVAQVSGSPWSLPKRPADPVKSSQAHVLVGSAAPRIVRICYLTGPDDSSVAVRANSSGGANQASNIYKGGCADVGGTDVEITNPNTLPVSGTYLLLPQPDKQASPL